MDTEITVAELVETEIDLLHPLLDEFVLSHGSLRFRDNYWPRYREWLLKGKNPENSRVLVAKFDGRIVGLAEGRIVDTGPILLPERIGYKAALWWFRGNPEREGSGTPCGKQ
jgi:hypothetical protein